jgi:general secretion pathway protein D
MRNFLAWVVGLAVGVLVSGVAWGADTASSFDFQSVPVGQAVSLYYKEVSTKPYVVCNDVLVDSRVVSMRAGGKVLDGAALAAFLDAYGFEAVDNSGVTVVCKVREKRAVKAEDEVPFLYRVKFRDSGYLVDLLSPMVAGTFSNRRQGPALAVGGTGTTPAEAAPARGGSAGIGAVSNSVGGEFIMFSGSAGEVKKLQALLAQVDIAAGEVLVKAYMYEVGKTSGDASALQLVLNALKGKVQISTGADLVENLVRLRTGSVDLVASALATDGRFKVVTAPFVRLRSGKTARFVSGDQRSVLGSIVTQQGTTQQSFERVESGTILEVSPQVRVSTVDVDLFQQVSSFVPGASSGQPPTLNKRELRTSLSMEDGEVVVLAGLNDAREDANSSGLRFLPFHLGKASSASSSELVLVLEMKRL